MDVGGVNVNLYVPFEKFDSVSENDTRTCRFDGKEYSSTELFLFVRLRDAKTGKERVPLFIYIENARGFIEDLEDLEKSSISKQNGFYAFYSEGDKPFSGVEEGESIIDCSVCGEDVMYEESCMSFPGFENDGFRTYKGGIGDHFTFIHEDCTDEIADCIRETLDSVSFEEHI